MATEGGGKVKPKRGHSSSKPYQRRKSLLGKVTDTVKDLLAPSWLTDFVSTVSKKTPPKDRNDALLEEDEDTFMSPAQSPSQLNSVGKSHALPQESDRRPLHPPAPRSHTVTTHHMDSTAPSTSMAPQQPTFSSSHLPFSKFTSQKTRLPNDTMSERSDISRSTSGCSSLIPHPDRQAYQREILQLNDSALEMLKTDFQSTSTFQGQKVASRAPPPPQQPSAVETRPVAAKLDESSSNPPKTWTADISRQGRPLAPAVREKPAFNTSLFGSPVMNNSSILGGSFGESSFYSGKTTYGGASAYRKLNQTAPYQTALPIRKQLKPKPLNSSLNAVTSSTARRILETLERMSTPLSDAKKIPANESSITDSVLSFTPGSYRRRPSRSFTGVGTSRKSFEIPARGPPTSQLKTPSIASISKNRQKILSSTPTTSRIAETRNTQDQDNDEDSDEDVIEIADQPGGGGGKGGKMKREKSYRSRPGRGGDDDDEVEIPSLRTDYTLPVGSLPCFNFNTTVGTTTKAKIVPPASTEDKAPNLKFTFSSPIQKSCPPTESSVEKTQGFKFSSPLKVTENETLSKSSTINASLESFKPVLNSTLTAPMSRLGNGGIGMTSKPQESSLGSGQSFTPATNLKQGSVMDVLGGSAFKPSSNLKQGSVMDVLGGSAFKPSSDLKQGSVMDVLGKDSSKPVVEGFGAANQLKSGSVMDMLGKDKSKSSVAGFGVASSLKSGSVMDFLGNSSSDSNSGLKTSQKLTHGSVMDVLGKKGDKSSEASGDDLMAKFRKPAGNWDCDTCLVQNKGESSKCVACGTSKPGSGPQLPPPASFPGTASGDLLSKFKKPTGSWDCDTCLVQNSSDSVKCVACGTKKPGSDPPIPAAGVSIVGSITSGQPSLASVFKTSAGSWSCDVCMVQNKPSDVKCVACQTTKPGATQSEEKKTEGPPSTSGFKISGSLTGKGEGGFTFGKTSSGGGFSFGSSDSKPALEGGFKIGQGFSFGQTSSKAIVTSPSDAGTGGDGGKKDSSITTSVPSSNQTSSITGGFQFDSQAEKKPQQVSESSTPSNGGTLNSFFKSGTETLTSDSKTSGLVFGGQSTVSEASKTTVTSIKSGTGASKGGFSFGQKSDSLTEKKSEDVFGSAGSLTSAGAFGFSQIGSGSSTVSSTGLSFGSTANTKPEQSKAEATVAPVAAGFGFGQQDTAKSDKPAFSVAQPVSGETKPASSLFTFGQAVGNADSSKPLGLGSGGSFTANSDATTKSKRGRDDDGAPAAKKSFTFGQTSASSGAGFNFGSAPSVTSASSVFAFGAGSGSTGSTESKPTVPSVFSFGSSSDASTAGTASATTTTAGAAAPSFAFGSKPAPASNTAFQFSSQQASTGTSSVFQFGSTPSGSQPGFGAFGSAPPTTVAPTASFGTTNTLPQPAFGNTANSNPQAGTQGSTVFGNSTSVFGTNNSATPVPAFGSTDQNANSGAFAFKMGNNSTSQGTAGTMNSASGNFNFGGGGGGVFQFSAKGNETSAGAPSQGSASSGFAFGSTQQPQPAAPAPNFNSTNAFSFTGNTGSFNIGSNPDSGRKIKRAVRKIRK